MGVLGFTIIYFLSPWLCYSVFSIPEPLIQESVVAFRLSGFGFLLGMITWWFSSIPTGLQRYDIYNGISIIYGTLNVVGNLCAAYMGYGIIGIVISNIISNIIIILMYIFYKYKILPNVRISWKFDLEMFKKTMSFGLYMLGFSIFAVIFNQLDKTVIGIFLSTSLLTFYLIPLSISGINQQINGKILQVMFPLSAELMAKNNIAKLQELFYRSLKMTIIVGLTVSIPLIAFSHPILSLWISKEMADSSSSILIILVIGFFLAGVVPYNIITGMGNPKIYTTSSMISGIGAIILFALLLKPFGIMGVAVGKLVSFIFTVIYYLHVSKKKLDISIVTCIKMLLIPLAISTVIILVGYYFSNKIDNLIYLIWFSGFSVITFIASMWITNQISMQEKELILSFVNKKKTK
jgi:O-antigen/teichoic acid export membrane protein